MGINIRVDSGTWLESEEREREERASEHGPSNEETGEAGAREMKGE